MAAELKAKRKRISEISPLMTVFYEGSEEGYTYHGLKLMADYALEGDEYFMVATASRGEDEEPLQILRNGSKTYFLQSCGKPKKWIDEPSKMRSQSFCVIDSQDEQAMAAVTAFGFDRIDSQFQLEDHLEFETYIADSPDSVPYNWEFKDSTGKERDAFVNMHRRVFDAIDAIYNAQLQLIATVKNKSSAFSGCAHT